jgi:Cu(I)/Ag(I) efflux system membrane fusion protein
MKMVKVPIKIILIAASLLLAAFLFGRLTGSHGGSSGDRVHSEDGPLEAAKKDTVWTCSMHPQFKLPKAGKCPLCFMDLIPLDSGDDDGDSDGLREISVSENSAKLMEIETVPVERRFVTADVRMVGKIDYDETRVSYITAWVPGRLDRLFVDYTGVPVKKGDHLVSLYSPELLSAQEELLQAIKATKQLAASDVSIVRDTTEATVTASREKLRLWGLKTEQIEAIETRGSVDDHVTIYAPSGGIVIHKNAQEGMYVKTGTRIYTIADLSQVWVTLDAYESDLAWLRYGQRVTFTTEAYPGEVFSGTVSFIQPVLDEATRTVKVRVNVPNENGRLKPGMFVRAAAEAQVATGGRVMDAALAGKWISPMHPEVVKDGPGSCDVCGMPLVRAESLGYVGEKATEDDRPLVIPASAPLLTGRRAVVYVAVPGKDRPTYEGREIVLGPRAGDYYLVKHGLVAGERVVTKGAFKLDAELQIRAKPSMMTPDGGGGEHAHHGGAAAPAVNGAESATTMKLPALVSSQLHDVIAAARNAVSASGSEDLIQTQEAYQLLKDRVSRVNADSLSGHTGMLWKEYSMLLGNDGVEGSSVSTLPDAAELAGMTLGHVNGMQAKLGLSHSGHSSKKSSEISPVFRKQLRGVVDQYLVVQRQLAEDNDAAARDAAAKGLASLKAVDMGLVTGKDHMAWMEHAGELKSLFTAISETDGIEPARMKFAILSEELVVVLARFGMSEGPLYKAWCPMAFDNRGASWIQSGEEISNPYFGETMLRCGEIKEVLK